MEEHPVGRPGPSGAISLRVSVTDRCRLRCFYCTPSEGVDRFAPAETLRYEEILRFVRLIKNRPGLGKVHITGGEPLDRRGVPALVAMLAGEGVEDLAMTTNGQRLGELAGALRRGGLRRLNISLNTLQPETFRRCTGGGQLRRTLQGIEAALRAGFACLKFNTTVIRGMNDDELADVARFGIERGAQVRFIELMPLGPAAGRHREWFVPSGEVLDRLRERFDLQPLPRRPGGSSREYQATDAAGRTGVIGVISPCTRPFCADCNRLRLTASGELVGCLATNGRECIRHLLRSGAPLEERQILGKVNAVLARKRGRDGFSSPACMVKVGG